MLRTCRPAATTVSVCARSGSARTPRNWAAPTAPRWPSPFSGATPPPRAAAPRAQGSEPARSPPGPDRVWQTSSVLSSSSWSSPSSPSSSLSSSSTLSSNEQRRAAQLQGYSFILPPISLLFCILCFVLWLFPGSNRVIALAVMGCSRRNVAAWGWSERWTALINLCLHLVYLPGLRHPRLRRPFSSNSYILAKGKKNSIIMIKGPWRGGRGGRPVHISNV